MERVGQHKTALGRFFVYGAVFFNCQLGCAHVPIVHAMRLRLLRRRLTISAPRVAIRNALPWPLRWLTLAVVSGFCAAVALWTFELGKSIAGLERVSPAQVLEWKAEIARLQDQLDARQTVDHAAQSLLTAEQAVKDSLVAQVRQLEADNRSLREDLGFFEKLLPATGTDGLAIRSLQAEVTDGMHLRWQLLIIQASRNAPDFNGRLEIVLSGVQAGKAWTQTEPPAGRALQFKQYHRGEGTIDLPPDTVVKTVSARVMVGTAVRATQAVSVD